MKFRGVEVWEVVVVVLMAVCLHAVVADLDSEMVASTQGLNLDESLIKPKVVGGSETDPGDYPYMVSVRFPEGFVYNGENLGGTHLCGGALIAKNIVLTAGHCLQPNNFNNLDVHIGRYFREGDDNGRFKTFKTIDTRVHPDFVYSFGWSDSDVALLVLDGQSEISPIGFVKDANAPRADELGTVIGWGHTVAGKDSKSDTLLRVEVPVVRTEECQRLYQDPSVITQYMVCAGKEGKDACQYDSGGPYLVNRKVAGIVSWGSGCGGKEPGVYARVGAVADWIQEQIDEINPEPPSPILSPEPVISPPTPTTPTTTGPGCIWAEGRWYPPGCRD